MPNKFTSDSWVVLSPMEQSIKTKVERIGKPLKEWNISINYGIKTGFNEAFIIDGKTKDELVKKSPNSADIIRPILRGRDIKRYQANFADLWIIATFPSKKYNIDDYPAVKEHLLSFGYDRLKQTGESGARKKTSNQWFETQDSISYWDDFSKQKIIYPNMTKFLPFYYDDKGYFTNQKCFIITGENIGFLSAFLNSVLFRFCFKNNFPELFGDTRELSKIFFEQIPVIELDNTTNEKFIEFVRKISDMKKSGFETKLLENEIDQMIFALYNLTSEEISFINSR
ncbi:MAG TPA: TaqI-like C-terminal specificity domain-containing protein [Saprospiraceae bacterium]|nr:TaqI-like C-terminal specificity domain-containing protein [Saprospiraceae bacterium]